MTRCGPPLAHITYISHPQWPEQHIRATRCGLSPQWCVLCLSRECPGHLAYWLEQLNIQFCRMHGGSIYILQVPQTFLVFCNLALAILHMRLSPVQAISMGSVSATVPECRMHYTPQTNSNYLITNCYIIHVINI